MNTSAHTLHRELTHSDDELLTMQEVADLVRVPVATLRYWRHLGTGPHSFRIGRSVRYWRTEVLRWLEDQSNDPQAARQHSPLSDTRERMKHGQHREAH